MTSGAGAPPPKGGASSLSSRSAVIALLKEHGLAADKRFGQNFLVERSVLEAIVDAAELEPSDAVFEVGAGLGVLTRELAARAGHVTTLELDARLLPVLDVTLRDLANVTLLRADALRFDLTTLPTGTVLVANLPYNVGTAVVAGALESGRFRRLVFLAQREVADRLRAQAGDPAYGALSLLVEHFGAARVIRTVGPGAFHPPPAVTSAVVRIDTRADARPAPALFRLIHAGFAHRRKTLVSSLRYAGYDREVVAKALEALGFDPRVRAEALSLADFRSLSAALPASQDDNGVVDTGILP